MAKTRVQGRIRGYFAPRYLKVHAPKRAFPPSLGTCVRHLALTLQQENRKKYHTKKHFEL